MEIKITAIETSLPALCIRQKDLAQKVLEIVRPSPLALRLYERLLNDESIESRYFAIDHLEELYTENLDEKTARFQRQAVDLCCQALRKLLAGVDYEADRLDALFICTCTGYLCPGLTSYIAQHFQLKADIYALDIVGAGCSGGLMALRAAQQFLKTHPKSTAAVIAVEICSAAIHWAEDPQLIVSNCIFSDGACACLLTNREDAPGLGINNIISRMVPELRDAMRFRYADARLCNVLSPKVPGMVADMALALYKQMDAGQGADFYAFHPGGRKVLEAVQDKLRLSQDQTRFSRRVLKDYGNLSSPSILFVLKDIWEQGCLSHGNSILAFSFGAGFYGLGLSGYWSCA